MVTNPIRESKEKDGSIGTEEPHLLPAPYDPNAHASFQCRNKHTDTSDLQMMEVEVLTSATPPTLQRGCAESSLCSTTITHMYAHTHTHTVMWAQAEAPADGTE